jgi:hypothetical protein
MSTHPYRGLPADQFWTTAIAPVPARDLDPVRTVKFTISASEPVATAGSCFAQHVGQHLKQTGGNFLQTEDAGAADEPVFSARFGTIATTRQLRQLLLGAYGLHRPHIRVWRRPDGRFIDPQRPQLFPDGFKTPEDVVAARRRHLEAVRRMVQDCRVFIFTLGQTEAWLADDGTALPVPPGAVEVELPGNGATFTNLTADDMRRDMDAFLADLCAVNPDIRVILTVSPVPLVATYMPRHVLVSNTYSKAALRVVAEEVARAHTAVEYFPSYEILTAPQARGGYFDADFRGITAAGIAHVMHLFTTHMMRDTAAAPAPAAANPALAPARPAPVITEAARAQDAAMVEILCEEDVLSSRSAR